MPELLSAMVATELVHTGIAFMQDSCLTYHFLFLVAADRAYDFDGTQCAHFLSSLRAFSIFLSRSLLTCIASLNFIRPALSSRMIYARWAVSWSIPLNLNNWIKINPVAFCFLGHRANYHYNFFITLRNIASPKYGLVQHIIWKETSHIYLVIGTFNPLAIKHIAS